jgi:ubiquinol-cytochrome c reductase cytochrome b subunit
VITRWVVRRLDDRLKFSPLSRTGLNKVFPDHWSFMMGEIALYSFMYLVMSGVFLTFFFESSTRETVYTGAYPPLTGSEVSAAYASSVRLSWDVEFGLVVRQSHHWAALVFVGAIVVHLCRIFFTGAFRRPREINWLVGLTLLVLAVVNGFVGYSLPDDLLSGTGLRVANAIILSIPVIGSWLDFIVFGGEFPGQDIVPRLYVAHILLVPGLIIALITLHMVILIRQKHSQFPGPGRTDTNVVGSRLWPGYAVRSLGLLAAVFAACLLLGGLVQINPIWQWGPFEPGSVIAPAQPDWYIGWVDGALRLWPPWEPDIFGYRLPTLFVPGVVYPLVVFGVLYLWPFLERLFTKDRRGHQVLERPRDRPLRVALGVAALVLQFVLLLAWSEDVISRYSHIPVYHLIYAFRIATLAGPLLTGTIAYVLARALRDSGAEGVLSLTASDLAAALRPRRPEDELEEEPEQMTEQPEQPTPPPEEPARVQERTPAPEEPGTAEVERPVEEHYPVEAGPVP